VSCPHRIEIEYRPRPCNGLNVEWSVVRERCILRKPTSWPPSRTGLQWLASGGDALVFGPCVSCNNFSHEAVCKFCRRPIYYFIANVGWYHCDTDDVRCVIGEQKSLRYLYGRTAKPIAEAEVGDTK
jgi:hypothetical protein